MYIDIDDRLDREYPERSECEVNERNCKYCLDHVCHQCGTMMCEACSVGVRHQPKLSKYTYESEDGSERIQQHCPDCIGDHALDRHNLAVGFGGLLAGLLFAVVGAGDMVLLTVVGFIGILLGIFVLRTEYRLKTRHNENYGTRSLW